MQEQKHHARKENLNLFNTIPLEIILNIYSFLPRKTLVSLYQVNHIWRKSAMLSLFEKHHPHDFIHQKMLAMHWNDSTAFELKDLNFFKKITQKISLLIENTHIDMYQKIFLLQLFHRLHNIPLYDNAFTLWLDKLIENVDTIQIHDIYIFSAKILPALFPFITEKQRIELIEILYKKLEKKHLSTWILIFLTNIRYALKPHDKEKLIEKYIQHIQNYPWLDAHTDLLIQLSPEITSNNNQLIMENIMGFLSTDKTGKNFKGIAHYWKNLSNSQRKDLIKIMLQRINDKNLPVQKNFHGILCSLHSQLSTTEIKEVIQKSLSYLKQGINKTHYFICHILSLFYLNYTDNNMKKTRNKLDKIIKKMDGNPSTCLAAAALFPIVKKTNQILINNFIENSILNKNWFPKEDSLQLLNPYIRKHPPVYALNNMLKKEPFDKSCLVSICHLLTIMKGHINDALHLHFINHLMQLFAKYGTSTRIVISKTLIQWLPDLPYEQQKELSAQLLLYTQDPFPWETRILVCEILYSCIKILDRDQQQIMLNTLKSALKLTRNGYCSKAALILERMIPHISPQEIPHELENILTIFLNPIDSLIFQEQALALYIKLICQPTIKPFVKLTTQIDCTLNLNEDSSEILCLKMFMRFYKPYNERSCTPIISGETPSVSLEMN